MTLATIMSDALVDAIIRGDEGKVCFLIRAGANVHSPFPDGMYPLNVALSYGHEVVAGILIEAGAPINRPDSFRLDECCRQPIHYACAANCVQIVDILLKRQVSIETLDFGDATPLHHAAANGHLKTVKFLLSNGANINHCSKSGRSGLWKAAQNNRRSMVMYLLSAGADSNVQNQLGATMLFDLAKEGLVWLAQDLIDSGLDIHKTDLVDNTALYSATELGKIESIELLLRNGIDINARNENGNTVLHPAANNDLIDTMVCLLNNGINVNIINRAKQSALFCAMLYKLHHSVKLLHLVGAKLTKHEYFLFENYEVHDWDKAQFYNWIIPLLHDPLPLVCLCRISLRNTVKPIPAAVTKLPLPWPVKRFLLLEDFVYDYHQIMDAVVKLKTIRNNR